VKRPVAMLDSIRISGFKSLASFELEDLPAACALVGPNCSGKSNLIRFFEMLSHGISEQGLGEYLMRNGGADAHLYCGHETTPQIRAEIGIKSDSGTSEYRLTLAHAQPDRLMFTEEAYRFLPTLEPRLPKVPWHNLQCEGNDRAAILGATACSSGEGGEAASKITGLLGNVGVYQFRDMSSESRIGMDWDEEDCRQLRPDGKNLAAVLLALERFRPRCYDWIRSQISRMVNTFDRFHIENGNGSVRLGWKEKGSDRILGPHDTTDGTLRIFALYTLLELPREMLPDLLFLDEPELGLNHWAIGLLGGMIRSLSVDKQIFVATQSTVLLDDFDLEQTVVMETNGGGTIGKRFKHSNFSVLPEDDPPTTGERYETGHLGGLP